LTIGRILNLSLRPLNETIYEFVKNARDEYYNRTIEVVPSYEFSQHETLRTIELYHSSRFTTGNKDTLKREKPFYNICKFRVNVAMRATDIDTKEVTIEAEDVGAYGQSFVLSLKNRKWMKQSDFAQLLNAMGFSRAKFGHVMVKKAERPGELQIHVVPWRDLIIDQVDISNGPKIFRHHFTPAALQIEGDKMGWGNIDEAIDAVKSQQSSDIKSKSKRNRTLDAKDRQKMLTSLFQIFQVVAQNPGGCKTRSAPTLPNDPLI
jgi:hypothetical protein